MNYESELNFVEELLKSYHIKLYLFDEKLNFDQLIKKILFCGDILSENKLYIHMYQHFIRHFQSNVIYRVVDGLLCQHVLFSFQVEKEKRVFAYIGSYIREKVDKKWIYEWGRKNGLSKKEIIKIESYYQELPVLVDDNFLMSIIYTLCSRIYGGIDKFTTEQIWNYYPANNMKEDINNHCKKVYPLSAKKIFNREKYYDIESQMIKAVSQGQDKKAEQLLSELTTYYFENELTNTLHNFKKYLIMLNTLLRLAVQDGEVPLLYSDKMFFSYVCRIDSTKKINEGKSLMKEMVYKYCLMVRNHSMKDYSLLIRKVLMKIDYDITTDLRLKSLADQLNVNHSYLSGLFKRELGCTLTDYVNQKRIEYAIFLLNSSNMQVQLVAQYSGFRDVNYFAKTFKKFIGVTPKTYRDKMIKVVEM